MRVDGKVAIVTGGGGGIGASLAAALTEAGAKVAVADLRDGERARAVVSGLAGSQVLAVGPTSQRKRQPRQPDRGHRA